MDHNQTPAHKPGMQKHIPDYGLYVGILFGISSFFFFVLQSNGVEVNWLWSGIIYLLCTVCAVWTTLRHALPGESKAHRIPVVLLLILVCVIFGSFGTVKQYRKEHHAAPSPQEAKEPSLGDIKSEQKSTVSQPQEATNQTTSPSPGLKTPAITHPSTPSGGSGDDLEIVDFNSFKDVTLQSNSRHPITVLGIISSLADPAGDSMSMDETMELKPNELRQFKFSDPDLQKLRVYTMKPLADTWRGQIEESKKDLPNCIQFNYLFPADIVITQVTEHYLELYGKTLPLGEAKGEIRYRIRGENKFKYFPLKAMVVRIDGCVPHQ